MDAGSPPYRFANLGTSPSDEEVANGGAHACRDHCRGDRGAGGTGGRVDDGWFPGAGGGFPFDRQDRPEDRRDWVADEVIDAEDFLTNLIAEQMIRDPDVRAGQMHVMVQNGVVILQGRVDTDDTRSAAVRRAWATPGVFDVCNMLAVGPDGRA